LVEDALAPNPRRASPSPRPSPAAQRGFLTGDLLERMWHTGKQETAG
jgi:hypothetical protein